MKPALLFLAMFFSLNLFAATAPIDTGLYYDIVKFGPDCAVGIKHYRVLSKPDKDGAFFGQDMAAEQYMHTARPGDSLNVDGVSTIYREVKGNG